MRFRAHAKSSFALAIVLQFFRTTVLLCSVLIAPRVVRGQSSSLYAQAESLVRSSRWDEALTVLSLLLKQEPRNLKALNLAGLTTVGKGDTKQANEYFSRAIAFDPTFVPALKNLSISEFNAGQYPEAEKNLLAAGKIAPDDPTVHLYLGEIGYRRQQYRSAAEQFSQARDLVLRSPAASAHLAVSYLLTGEKQNALELIDTLSPEKVDPRTQTELALALDQAGLPQRAAPYLEMVHQQFQDSYDVAFDLVLVDLEAKLFPQAISLATDVIAKGHETAELDNVLAQAHEGNGEPQLALDAYRHAIALDPDDEENYLDLASLCMNQKAIPAGMAVVEAGLRDHTRSARLIFMRGLLNVMQGDLEAAENDFKLSEMLSPASSLGSIGLADSYMQTGHTAEAMEVLRQRLSAKPNDATLLYLLGETLVRSGAQPRTPAYAEAQTALERSTTLNPNLCLPHVSLGTMYLDEGRNQDAVIQFEKARAIDPKERSIYSHLAVAYKRLGQPDKSRDVLTVLKGMLNQEHEDAIYRMKTTPASSIGPS